MLKVEIFVEVLLYICCYYGKIVVIKYGGNVMMEEWFK